MVEPAPHRYAALDAMRGIAALGVVGFHIGATSGITQLAVFRVGNQFVDFFFVLSGFVIAFAYGGKLQAGMPLGHFMALRLGRVWPLHFAMVLAFLAVELAVYFSSGTQTAFQGLHSPWHLFRSVFLLDAWFPDRRNYFSGVSWSISVEMLLYLLAALAFRSGKWAQAALVAAAPVALWLHWNGWQWPILTDSMQRGLGGFGLGVAAYWLHRRWQEMPGSPHLLALAALCLFAANMLVFAAVPIAIPAAFVVLVFAGKPGIFGRLLTTAPMAWIGRISYSIYMVHGFVITSQMHLMAIAEDRFGLSLVRRVSADGIDRSFYQLDLGWLPATLIELAMIASVLAVAHLTWAWIEEPARRWSRRMLAEKSPLPSEGLSAYRTAS